MGTRHCPRAAGARQPPSARSPCSATLGVAVAGSAAARPISSPGPSGSRRRRAWCRSTTPPPPSSRAGDHVTSAPGSRPTTRPTRARTTRARRAPASRSRSPGPSSCSTGRGAATSVSPASPSTAGPPPRSTPTGQPCRPQTVLYAGRQAGPGAAQGRRPRSSARRTRRSGGTASLGARQPATTVSTSVTGAGAVPCRPPPPPDDHGARPPTPTPRRRRRPPPRRRRRRRRRPRRRPPRHRSPRPTTAALYGATSADRLRRGVYAAVAQGALVRPRAAGGRQQLAPISNLLASDPTSSSASTSQGGQFAPECSRRPPARSP